MSKKGKVVKVTQEEIKQDPELLSCKLNEKEKLEVGRTLADQTVEKAQLEAAMKRVGSDFKAKIAAKDADISINSNKLQTGIEYRQVNVKARLNTPEPGQKTIIRQDTFEPVRTCNMTATELQRNLPFEETQGNVDSPETPGGLS